MSVRDFLVDKFNKKAILYLPEPTDRVDETLPLFAVRINLGLNILSDVDLFNEGLRFYNNSFFLKYYSNWFYSNIYELDYNNSRVMFAYNISNDSLYLLKDIPCNFKRGDLDLVKILESIKVGHFGIYGDFGELNKELTPRHLQIGKIIIKEDYDFFSGFSPQNMLKLIRTSMPQMVSNKIFSVQPMAMPSSQIAYVQPVYNKIKSNKLNQI